MANFVKNTGATVPYSDMVVQRVGHYRGFLALCSPASTTLVLSLYAAFKDSSMPQENINGTKINAQIICAFSQLTLLFQIYTRQLHKR